MKGEFIDLDIRSPSQESRLYLRRRRLATLQIKMESLLWVVSVGFVSGLRSTDQWSDVGSIEKQCRYYPSRTQYIQFPFYSSSFRPLSLVSASKSISFVLEPNRCFLSLPALTAKVNMSEMEEIVHVRRLCRIDPSQNLIFFLASFHPRMYSG